MPVALGVCLSPCLLPSVSRLLILTDIFAQTDVAQEVVDAFVATKRHEIVLLSRKDAPAELPSGVTWAKADYDDPKQLAGILRGVHTVLSFIIDPDPKSGVQKNLIDAAVQAGVKRFAPSEWGS